MADNPILASDLLKNDGAIQKAIDQLLELDEVHDKTSKNIQERAKITVKNLTKVSGATMEQRDQIEEAAVETQKLTVAQKKLDDSRTETAKSLAALKLEQQESNKLTKLQIKLNKAEEGSYDKLSAQYSLNKIALNKMSDAQRKTTKSGQDLVKQTKDLSDEMKELQEATGKNTLSVGDYAGQLGGLVPSFQGAIQGAKGLVVQFWALVANPVGAIIAAIAATMALLFKAISNTAGGAAFLEKAMAALGVVFDTVLGRLGDFLTGQISFMDLLTKTDDAIEKNIKASNKLVDARRALARLTAESELAEANLGKEIAKLAVIRESDVVSLSKRQKAAKELALLEVKEQEEIVKRAKLNQDIAQQELDIARGKGKSSEEARKASTALTSAMAETARTEAQLIATRGESADKLGMIQLDIFEQELDLLLDIADRNKIINESRIKSDATTMAQKRELLNENIFMIEDNYDKQIKAFERLGGVQVDEVALLQMTGSEILKYADKLGFSERAVNRLREVVIEKNTADQDNLDTLRDIEIAEKAAADAAIARAEKLLVDSRNAEIAAANQMKAFRESEIDLLEATEEEKTRLRLEAEKNRLLQVLAINKFMAGELSDLEIETLRNTIKKIDQEMAALLQDDSRKTIYDYLGFSDEEAAGAQLVVQSIVSGISDVVNARVDAANSLAETTKRELDAAQTAYDTQLELRNQGEISNVEAAERQLGIAKENNDKAIAEQRRAREAQARIETAQQVSSLITASANIFKALSGAGPLGVLLATAAIGTMFAAFAKSRSTAQQAARYGDGGTFDIGGGSHASGHDTSFGVHGGLDRRVEGGEKAGIFSRKAVKRYGKNIHDVVTSMNKGIFEKKYGGTFNQLEGMPEGVIFAGQSGDSEGLKDFVRMESHETRKSFSSAVKAIPQTVWGVDNRGLNKSVRTGNTTKRKITQENKFWSK
jgi:hypothetical protein